MNSLVFKVKLLGAFASVLVTVMTYFAMEYAITFSKGREITNSILLYQTIRKNSPLTVDEYLKKHNFIELSKSQALEILDKASFVIETPIYREVFESGNIKLYSFENYYYYSFNIQNKIHYFKNLEKDDNYITYLFLAVIFLILILLSIYIYIIKAIKPLKNLYTKIHSFSNKSGDLSSEISFKNKDEISLVTSEFDKAVERIKKLRSTRTLFLRNIMHEFKTPLTQGTLMVHMLEVDEEDKEKFLHIFNRMKEQLEKLAQLESLTSDDVELKWQELSMLDVIDDVKDILDLEDDSIDYEPITQTYRLNAELFVVALKNLIANAIAYSSDHHVQVVHKNEHLYIINKGGALRSSFEVYTKAFVRDNLTKNGMGLGLYLSKEIFIRHNIKMKYRYLNGSHVIILKLKNIIIK